MADHSEDIFARVYGMYEDTRDQILASDAYQRGRDIMKRASNVASSTAQFAGNSAWIIGTALVIGILPAFFAIDRELNPVPPGGPEFPLMEPPPTAPDGTVDAAAPAK